MLVLATKQMTAVFKLNVSSRWLWLHISSDRTWTRRPPKSQYISYVHNSICSGPLKPPLWTVMNTERARRTVDRSLLFAQQIEGGKLGRLKPNATPQKASSMVIFFNPCFESYCVLLYLMRFDCFLCSSKMLLLSASAQITSLGARHQAETKTYTFAIVPVSVAYLNLTLCFADERPFYKTKLTVVSRILFLK